MVIKKQEKNIIQNTEKHIIEHARKLFSKYSYLGVSMNDISKKLNITKAALYYHFNSKDEIYKKVLDEVFDKFTISINEAFEEKTTDKKLHKLIKNYLDFGFKEKNLITALMFKLSPKNSQIKKHIIQLKNQVADLIHPLIEEVITNKKLIYKVDIKLTTSLLIGMMDGLLLEYSFLNKKFNSNKISSQIIMMLF